VSAAELFEREMSVLRENIYVAIDGGRSEDLRRGLRIYERILDLLHNRPGSTAPSLRRPQPEFSWLIRDVYAYAEAATAQAPRIRSAMDEFIFSQTIRNFSRGNADIAQSLLRSFGVMWRTALDQAHPATGGILEDVLLQVQNITELVVPHADVPATVKSDLGRAGVDLLTEMARAALLRSDSRWFLRATGYLHGLLRFTEWPAENRIHRDSSLLALLAYCLMLQDREKRDSIDVELPDVPVDILAIAREALLVHLRDIDLRAAQLLAGDREGGRTWRYWEMELSLPVQAHALQFSSYVDKAITQVAIRYGRLPVLEGEDGYYLAKRLRQIVGDRNAQVASQLDRVVTEFEAAEMRDLQERSIEAERVTAFESALMKGLSDDSRLLRLFRRAPFSDEDASRVIVGMNWFVPKDYFVTSRVYAQPESLGETLAQALLRGEEDWLLTCLISHAESIAESADLSGVSERIKERTADFAAPTVVALNSWSASNLLTAELGYRVSLVYTDNGDAQVLCWDRESLPEVEATPEPREDLAVLGDTGFSYGVFDEGATDDAGHPRIRVETGELLRWSKSLDDDAVKVLRVKLRGDAAF
jgi:hypothetical protein